MFNRTQWLIVGSLYIIGVFIHASLTGSSNIYGSIGFMISALLIGLLGGVIGRKKSEQGATSGIIIGFVIAFALMTSKHWT